MKKLFKLKDALLISLSIGIVFLLAACGGSGGSSGGGVVDGVNDEWLLENNDRIGFVTFAELKNLAVNPILQVSGLDVDVEASFFAISSELVAAFIALTPEIPVGTCVVNVISLDFVDEDFSFPELPDTVTTSMVSIDAGAELSVTAGTNGLPYTTLLRNTVDFSGQTFYAYDNGTDFDDDVSAPPVPADMALIIPGAADGFPSMTVDIPNVRPMILNTPGLTGDFSPAIIVSSTTAFDWVPREQNDPESYVRIFAAQSIPTATNNKYVECNVADTGTFAFSAATQNELVGFEGTLWDFSRVVRAVQENDSGATVILDVERGISTLGGLGIFF